MIHSHEHKDHCQCHTHEHGCACCTDAHKQAHGVEEETSIWQPALSMAMLVAGIVMTAMNVQWFNHPWVKAAWYVAAWLPTGLGVLREAIEAARDGDLFSDGFR